MTSADLTRIVSLEPSATATLLALGQGGRLVAVSTWCDRLIDVGDRPRLPPTWSASPEEVVALSPDLVIASVPYRAKSITGLLRAGLDVLCLYPKCLGDVYAHIAWLGRLTDATAGAERLIARMQADFEATKRQAAGLDRPRVYVEMWPEPLMSGPGWTAELVEIAGGRFVPGGPGRAVTSEEVIRADPEVIVVAWPGIADPPLGKVAQRSGWEGLSAMRQGRVLAIDEIWINAPGPNLSKGARLLAAAIHPEAFSTGEG